MRNSLKTSVKTKEIPYGVRSTGWLRNQRPASSIFPHKSLVINGVNAPYEAKLAQPCGTSSKSGRWKEEEPFLLSPPWSPGQQREIDPETGHFFEFDGGRALAGSGKGGLGGLQESGSLKDPLHASNFHSLQTTEAFFATAVP